MTITVKADLAFIDGKLLGHVLHRTPPTPLGTIQMMTDTPTPTKQASTSEQKYTQILLNDRNTEQCRNAAVSLQSAFTWKESPEGHDYWQEINDKLIARSDNGTNDGLPRVNPEPTIEDGYRKATPEDKDRHDREYWFNALGRKEWRQAKVGVIAEGAFYQVPVDRVPTDEDAKGRPTAFARDSEGDDWRKVELMRVWSDDRTYRFHCDLLEDDEYDNFVFCRFPYEGELDED